MSTHTRLCTNGSVAEATAPDAWPSTLPHPGCATPTIRCERLYSTAAVLEQAVESKRLGKSPIRGSLATAQHLDHPCIYLVPESVITTPDNGRNRLTYEPHCCLSAIYFSFVAPCRLLAAGIYYFRRSISASGQSLGSRRPRFLLLYATVACSNGRRTGQQVVCVRCSSETPCTSCLLAVNYCRRNSPLASEARAPRIRSCPRLRPWGHTVDQLAYTSMY